MYSIYILPLLLACGAALLGGTLFYAWRRSRVGAGVVATLAFVAAFGGALGNAQRDKLTLRIIEPPDQSDVALRQLVRGTISDPHGTVLVLVRPLSTDRWWVQDAVVQNDEGAWQIMAYFGTESVGRGERYAVVALGTGADSDLIERRQPHPGEILKELPAAQAVSNTVFVRRTQ